MTADGAHSSEELLLLLLLSPPSPATAAAVVMFVARVRGREPTAADIRLIMERLSGHRSELAPHAAAREIAPPGGKT